MIVADIAAARVEAEIDRLGRLYELVYALPVGSAGAAQAGIVAHAARDGFSLKVAREHPDGPLVGFAYGFTGSAGQPWREAMADAVGPELASVWLDGHFEFAEFGVVPGSRRRGIGSALYDTLFLELPHSHSVLTVREGNTPAVAFYGRHGWQTVHRGFVSPSGHGPYQIMGLDMKETTE